MFVSTQQFFMSLSPYLIALSHIYLKLCIATYRAFSILSIPISPSMDNLRNSAATALFWARRELGGTAITMSDQYASFTTNAIDGNSRTYFLGYIFLLVHHKPAVTKLSFPFRSSGKEEHIQPETHQKHQNIENASTRSRANKLYSGCSMVGPINPKRPATACASIMAEAGLKNIRQTSQHPHMRHWRDV